MFINACVIWNNLQCIVNVVKFKLYVNLQIETDLVVSFGLLKLQHQFPKWQGL